MTTKDKLIKEKLPKHVAIIMDGNGRWARKHGNERLFGHQHGVTAVREVTEAAAELQIGYLTLYAFSTENWSRPQYEIDGLMQLFVKAINEEYDTLQKNNIRLRAIGNLDNLPPNVREELMVTIDATAKNTGLNLILALSYGSRWEIQNAMQKIAEDVKNQQLQPSDITTETIDKHLTTNGIPDPELLIRTSGEYRISNFLLWQIAYSELYFTDILWPDFRKEDFYEALHEYQSRERRFGKTGEQLDGE